MGTIETVLIGGLAGWLAGKVMRGQGYGALVNILLGLVGGFVGGLAFGVLGIHTHEVLGRIACAFGGSVLVVWLARQLTSK
jgi:uncharacterized membrane protein YeaQ/YmgE (transglycosylase-associated protein family)